MNARFARSLSPAALPGAGQFAPLKLTGSMNWTLSKPSRNGATRQEPLSADGQTLLLAKRGYGREFGTPAERLLGFNLEIPADRFTTFVAADGELIQPGNVEFRVVGGGQTPV